MVRPGGKVAAIRTHKTASSTVFGFGRRYGTRKPQRSDLAFRPSVSGVLAGATTSRGTIRGSRRDHYSSDGDENRRLTLLGVRVGGGD